MKLQRQYTNNCLLMASPIWNNPLLTAGGITLAKSTWQHQSITQIGQIIEDGDIIPFHELKIQSERLCISTTLIAEIYL